MVVNMPYFQQSRGGKEAVVAEKKAIQHNNDRRENVSTTL